MDHFTFPLICIKFPISLQSHQHLLLPDFNSSHPSRYEVIYHCRFHLHFLQLLMRPSIFSYASRSFAYLYKNFDEIFANFLIELFFFLSLSYELFIYSRNKSFIQYIICNHLLLFFCIFYFLNDVL